MRKIIYFLMTTCMLVPAALGALNDWTFLNETTNESELSPEQQLIVVDRPSDYGLMVEEAELSASAGPAENMPADGFNALWVTDYTGEMNDSLSMPIDGYARVFITPIQAGNVVVEHLYPDDQLDSSDMGAVEAFHTYRIWFYGNMNGTHQMRYNVNGGEYSNVVEFYVS
jgi:hypothetical protein